MTNELVHKIGESALATDCTSYSVLCISNIMSTGRVVLLCRNTSNVWFWRRACHVLKVSAMWVKHRLYNNTTTVCIPIIGGWRSTTILYFTCCLAVAWHGEISFEKITTLRFKVWTPGHNSNNFRFFEEHSSWNPLAVLHKTPH